MMYVRQIDFVHDISGYAFAQKQTGKNFHVVRSDINCGIGLDY